MEERYISYRLFFAHDAPLRGALEIFLQKLVLPRFSLFDDEHLTLAKLETMLDQSIDQWTRKIRVEGIWKGRQEGEARLLLRLLRLKFGPLDPETEERVRSADADRLLEWGDRVLTAENPQDVFRG